MTESPTKSILEAKPIRHDRALFALVAILLLVLFGRWFLTYRSIQPSSLISSPKHVLDLNQATASEMEQLPGFGPGLASRTIRFREDHGPFESIEDLKNVGGIGDRTIEKIKPWVTLTLRKTTTESLDPEPDRLSRQSPKIMAVAPARTATMKSKPGDSKLNINSASAEELVKLPGIGIQIAKRIIEARSQRAFSTIDDLRRVSGIGPKRLDAIRELVCIQD